MADRRSSEAHVEAILGAAELDFEVLLHELPRAQLKRMCEALGLDTGGRAKALLVQRLVGPATPASSDNDRRGGHDSDDDELEEEDLGAPIKPWDPRKIRITTKNFTLREVVEQIKDGEIDLSPDFQREFVWKDRQRTRLVESILLGIPLPAFYFNQERDGTYQVVDGVQRLSTVSLFMDDGHVLDAHDAHDLEYLQELRGLTYSKLEPAATRRFRATQIVVHVIEPQTPEEVKYDIFSRVNTLGSPLSAQEIRHAMSKQRSRDFLRLLVELPSFERATGGQFAASAPGRPSRGRRMADRELALRFCAFRNYSEHEYRQHESLDAYLVDFTRRIDGRSDSNPPLDDTDLENLVRDFDAAMGNAADALANAAFRRYPLRAARKGPINRAVFEAQAVALADYSSALVLSRKDRVAKALRRLFSDAAYDSAVRVGTGDPTTVNLRLTRTRQALAEVLS